MDEDPIPRKLKQMHMIDYFYFLWVRLKDGQGSLDFNYQTLARWGLQDDMHLSAEVLFQQSHKRFAKPVYQY